MNTENFQTKYSMYALKSFVAGRIDSWSDTNDKNLSWYKAADVCRILKFAKTERTVKMYVPDHCLILHNNTYYISDVGVWLLIFQSKTEEAKEFRYDLAVNVLSSTVESENELLKVEVLKLKTELAEELNNQVEFQTALYKERDSKNEVQKTEDPIKPKLIDRIAEEVLISKAGDYYEVLEILRHHASDPDEGLLYARLKAFCTPVTRYRVYTKRVSKILKDYPELDKKPSILELMLSA